MENKFCNYWFFFKFSYIFVYIYIFWALNIEKLWKCGNVGISDIHSCVFLWYPSNICGLNCSSKYVAKNIHLCQNNPKKKVSRKKENLSRKGLSWYVETPHRYFRVNFEKCLKALLTSFGGCFFLSQDAKHQNTLWQLQTMDSLFDGKDSQWGNKFLPITDVYLKPSRKFTMKLFCKNS